MDTKQIKQKILDLAIRGKLVPQNPADEPASVLLERIKAEKAQLIKEGKIKKEKPLEPMGEIPFEIPQKWSWCLIGEILNLQAGKNITASDIHEKSEVFQYPCYGGNGIRGYVAEYNRDGFYPIIGRQGALCGNINVAKGHFYATEHAVVVESFANVSIELITYFLRTLNLNQYATATAQPGLAVATINTVYIPLPPLEEQKRIVAEIDRWFKWIDELEQNQQDLHTAIKQAKSKILDLAIHGKLVPQDANDEPASVLLDRIKAEKAQLIKEGKIKKEKPFPEIEEVPFEIPESWEWCRLGEIGNWQSGGTPSRTNKSYYEGNIPWLKTGDLNDGFITSIPESISEDAVANSSAKLNPVNSVLIAMYGATIGKVGILTFPATTNQACCACSYYQPVEMLYLFYFLLSQRSEFISKGGGGAQPNISKEIIVKTEFPLPPLAEQKRIVLKIEELFAQLDKIEESLN